MVKKELVKKEPEKGLATHSLSDWFFGFPSLREVIDRWFDDFWSDRPFTTLSTHKIDWEPKVDIKDGEKDIVVSVSLPGVDKDKVNVEVSDGILSIKGEREEQKEEKTKNYIRKEQSYGSFYRSFRLPDNVKEDEIKATHKNGILEITIPKSEQSVSKAKRITIE